MDLPGGSVDLHVSPTIEHIKQRGELVVGLSQGDPHFAARDDMGHFTGFDVEFAHVLASELGLNGGQVAFKMLPPTLQGQAVSTGSIDLQFGVDANKPGFVTVGPYVIASGARPEHLIGINDHDPAMRDQLQRVLDATVADGSWQRTYNATLGPAGIPAHPPEHGR